MNNTVELEPLDDGWRMDKTREETKYLCTPCQTEDEVTEAHNYCTECEKYFCNRCLKFHNKFSNCQSSNVLDRSEIDRWGQKQGPTEMRHKCEKHPNKDIEMYCKAHDIVCCHVCVALEHRSCNNIVYIPSVAKNLQATDMKKIIESSQTIIKEAKAKKTKEEHQKIILDESKEKYKASVSQVKQTYMSILDSLEEKTTKEMSQLYKKQSEAIQKALCDLDMVTDTMEDVCKTMTTEMDDCSKFIQFKESGRKISEAKRILQSTNRNRPTYKFTIDQNVENFLKAVSNLEMNPEKQLYGASGLGHGTPEQLTINNMSSLCSKPIEAIKECKLYGKWEYGYFKTSGNILWNSKTNTVLIREHFFTVSRSNFERQSGRTDEFIKKEGKNTKEGLLFQKQSSFTPFIDICEITDNDVALIQSDGSVLLCPGKCKTDSIVKSDSGVFTKKMTFKHDCFAIAHHNGILYITSHDGSLYMYDLVQTLIKKVETDQTGNRCFVKPMFVTKSHDKTRLHVTDYFRGLITLDMSGEVLTTFSHPKLVGACGITTEIEGYLLVSGYHSKNVLQMSITGDQIIKVIIDGLSTPPFRLSYLSTLSCLLVSDATCDNDIQAFKIKKKDEQQTRTEVVREEDVRECIADDDNQLTENGDDSYHDIMNFDNDSSDNYDDDL